MVRNNLFLDPKQIADMNWHERLIPNELAFIGGLMVSQVLPFVPPSELEMDAQYKRAEALFGELHTAHLAPMRNALLSEAKRSHPRTQQEEEAIREIFNSAALVNEAILYGSEGAFDFQYFQFAKKRYELDRAWFEKNIGFTLASAELLARHLKKLIEQKARAFKQAESHEDFCQKLLDIFCFRLEDLEQFDSSETRTFLHRFSLQPGSANAHLQLPGQYNELEARPIVRLVDGRYWLPISFLIAESIYLSPFYWISADKEYASTGFKHRGEATAQIAADLIRPVFGAGHVFRDVQIVGKKGQIKTDADVLVTFGNKALVLQVKSKKLTALSRSGDEGQLRKDFQAAIQEAYEQGLVCKKAILDKESRLIDADGNTIPLNERINGVYLICVTSDPYPAVEHQLRSFLQKPTDEPYPVAISVFDLDLITFYLNEPFDLLYYLRQRVALSSMIEADTEMAVLAFHLNRKLWPELGFNKMLISDEWAQLIDAHFPVAKGETPYAQSAEKLRHKWKNPAFERLLQQVKATGNPGLTDAVFFLYDLSGGAADALINGMNQSKNQSRRDGSFHSFSMTAGDDAGISYICRNADPDRLPAHTMSFALAKKYQMKRDVWLALGTMAKSPNEVDFVAFNADAWVEDPELEQMSKRVLRPGTAINLHKNIGRNDRCYCGSGRKYKKCHGG
jgi:hypothetical protein